MSPRRASAVREDNDVTPAAALRRHLIAVTQKLLELHGLAGLTTRQIAREASVSDGVLYNHFQGKDGLVLAALTDSFSAMMAEFRESVPKPGRGEVRDNLVQLADACARYLARVFPMGAGLASQPALMSQAMTAVHADTSGPPDVLAVMAEYISEEQARGRLDPATDATSVTLLLFGACQVAAMVTHIGDPAALPGSRTTTDLVDAVLAGLGA